MTDTTLYGSAALHNTTGQPHVLSQYCNGSRVPPELGTMGYQVPPGISDATVPNPIFSLTPAATVDEGNNWINYQLGPADNERPCYQHGPRQLLAGCRVSSHQLHPAARGSGRECGLAARSGAPVPNTDFFGNPRACLAVNQCRDAGAVEFREGGGATPTLTSISPGHRPAQNGSFW